MIFGYWSALIGFSISLGSLGFLLILDPLLILVSCIYIIHVEEPWTEERFGEEYSNYRKSTPRFIPSFKYIHQ